MSVNAGAWVYGLNDTEWASQVLKQAVGKVGLKLP